MLVHAVADKMMLELHFAKLKKQMILGTRIWGHA